MGNRMVSSPSAVSEIRAIHEDLKRTLAREGAHREILREVDALEETLKDYRAKVKRLNTPDPAQRKRMAYTPLSPPTRRMVAQGGGLRGMLARMKSSEDPMRRLLDSAA